MSNENQQANRDSTIREKYGPQKAAFIHRMLTDDHLAVIDSTGGMGIEDYLPVAITEWICTTKKEMLPLFEGAGFHYKDAFHHRQRNMAWLVTAEYLLEQRLGRKSNREEVIEDLRKSNHGVKHRVWYAARFPDKVEIHDVLRTFFTNEEYLR